MIYAKKAIVLLLSFMTLLTLAACSGGKEDTSGNGQTGGTPAAADAAASGNDYEGSWYDIVSQRCGMTIDAASDNKYNVKVMWGSSAYETTEWIMTAEFNRSDGTLRYTDGKKQTVSYDTEDSDPVYDVIHTGSAGFLRYQNGRIYWSDEKDHESSDGRLFMNSYEEMPDDLKYLGFYYRDDDASSVEIYYDKGAMMITIDITRLCSMSGSAYYDEEKGVLVAVVSDPNENPMDLSLKKTETGGLTVTVTNSTWDYIQNGDIFDFT